MIAKMKLVQVKDSFYYNCYPMLQEGNFGEMEKFMMRTADAVIVPPGYVSEHASCTVDKELNYAREIGKQILFESLMNI